MFNWYVIYRYFIIIFYIKHTIMHLQAKFMKLSQVYHKLSNLKMLIYRCLCDVWGSTPIYIVLV